MSSTLAPARHRAAVADLIGRLVTDTPPSSGPVVPPRAAEAVNHVPGWFLYPAAGGYVVIRPESRPDSPTWAVPPGDRPIPARLLPAVLRGLWLRQARAWLASQRADDRRQRAGQQPAAKRPLWFTDVGNKPGPKPTPSRGCGPCLGCPECAGDATP